jgi:putative oxidoreductase
LFALIDATSVVDQGDAALTPQFCLLALGRQGRSTRSNANVAHQFPASSAHRGSHGVISAASRAIRQDQETMNDAVKPLPALGRILLALIFVLAGISKLGAIAATSANMASHGIPYAHDLVWGAVALELGGGLMLMAGFLTRLVALALFFYTLALAFLFHPYWTMTGAAERAQHGVFFGHLAIMGGMLFVVAFGSGPYSIDTLIWRRSLVQQPA